MRFIAHTMLVLLNLFQQIVTMMLEHEGLERL